MKTKRCTKHKDFFPDFSDELPADEDHFRRMKGGYLDSWCRKCKAIDSRNRRAKKDELVMAPCSICGDEFWEGNLVYKDISGATKYDYRVCRECEELLDNGHLERGEDYEHEFEKTNFRLDWTGFDDEGYRHASEATIDKKHKEAMKARGLYRHLQPGDEGFEEMAKLYGTPAKPVEVGDGEYSKQTEALKSALKRAEMAAEIMGGG